MVRHLFQIQVVRHDELLAKANALCSVSTKEAPQRGSIYDRHGNLLVGEITYYDVQAYLPKFKDIPKEDLINDLSLVFGTSRTLLETRLKNSRVNIQVQRHVDIEIVDKIQKGLFAELPHYNKLRNPKALQRLHFNLSFKRYYPKKQLMAHVVGYLAYNEEDKKDKGMIGIERAYDHELTPKEMGEESYLRDPTGRKIPYSQIREKAAVDGSNVYLTLDERIQNIIERELKLMVDKFLPKKACIIMARPQTGEILGMAQYPSMDPSDRSDLTPDRTRNSMLLDFYEPGSTMKGISIAGALDYGVVNLGTLIDCEKGRWYFAGKLLRDSHIHPKQFYSTAQVVEMSSNIGTAKIGLLMGKKRVFTVLRKFGFGQITGLGLDKEGIGQLRHVRKWGPLSTTRIPMGQGINVTPMQMVQAYCGLANKGMMMQLYAVDRIEDTNTDSVTVFQPQSKRRVISESAAKKITEALQLVVHGEDGTAHKAAVEGYRVAGKTGTGQVWDDVNHRYSETRNVASFIGYVPAENPEFVLLVVATEPSKISQFGGTVAGPTFKRISEKTLNYLKTSPLK